MRQRLNATWLPVRLNLSVAVVYFVATRFAITLIESHPNAGSLWPASGIAFAALIVLGTKLWPGIFLGALFAMLGPQTSLSDVQYAAGAYIRALHAVRVEAG